MLNFYNLYNKNGLYNEHYGSLIDQLIDDHYYTIELKPIEHIIKKSSWHAYYYALNIIKEKFHEDASNMMEDQKRAVDYVKHKWAASVMIGKGPCDAYNYALALDIINDGIIDAESIIMTSPFYACHYAKNILNKRWIEAEPVIKESEHNWDLYCKAFNIC